MFKLTDSQLHEARHAIRSASARPDVHSAIASLYADVQIQIDLRRPLCILSGRCCRFEEFGHHLYVTTLELATFLHDLQSSNASPDPAWTGQGCPFQRNKLCSVHAIRPFGCRLFFCDSTSTDWQHEQYHLFHTRLKSLHDSLNVPYFYLEWRQALTIALDLGPIS
ncbi:MAG TPA: YkgJ family cysteine cluster protein [Tepidisphaeraceae bacterium]|jgi:Fe-S-cluster containining protein|nr:YkgJ family cysteine cluster protein [Tepidisphaeraceae bacterium]